jgi:hypothetical protein
MPQRCRTCSRVNPNGAHYCYYDGVALDHRGSGPLALGPRPFLSPFVFPSGRACRNFDELVLACEGDWNGARDMLRQGYLESFLAACGRGDLAVAARQAARGADLDRSLDELLNKMPGDSRTPPRLRVQPLEINLGSLRRDEERRFALHLENQGMGLLTGSVACEATPWLVLGEGGGSPRKLFQCRHDFHLNVRVHGKALRAGPQPLEGRLVVACNGGTVAVTVRAEVPVEPYPSGVLAGARSPRQAAEKARDNPHEAAPLFERGAVAAWYEANGWTYPVQGPPASGLGAVQQFFEALGLARAPKVEISQRAIHFQGPPGVALEHTLVVQTAESRPVFAHATTGAPWLRIGRTVLDGRLARIPLKVPEVPARPGQSLCGKVQVTANGNQRFLVEVSLTVSGREADAPATVQIFRDGPTAVGAVPVILPLPGQDTDYRAAPPPVRREVVPPVPSLVAVELPPEPEPVPIELLPIDLPAVIAPDYPKDFVAVAPPPAPLPEEPPPPRRHLGRHLLGLLLLAVALAGALVHDLLVPAVDAPLAAEEGVDPTPYLEVRFHDGPKDDTDRNLPPTMRFGLVLLREHDPTHPTQPRQLAKKLTFDLWGRTNNTCLRVDGEEVLFGFQAGTWVAMKEPLAPDARRHREGFASRWRFPKADLLVTQEVEIVPGESSHKLDTCVVRYLLDNRDTRPHLVGIRFLLDTFIGANDGVPFTIPGAGGLCDTKVQFATPAAVPDFIEALENDDLRHPGTVARVQFRLGNRLEAPQRVMLGGWPNRHLQGFGFPNAEDGFTLWDVPFIDIRGMDQRARGIGQQADPDSAVTMYWQERQLAPRKVREVGFAYGLSTVSSDEGDGRLLLTVGGRLVHDGEFTLTALVQDPRPDERLRLALPPGFRLVGGSDEQAVPPVPAGAVRRTSPVTWRIRAGGDGRYELLVRSSQGAAQKQPVIIRTQGIFD